MVDQPKARTIPYNLLCDVKPEQIPQLIARHRFTIDTIHQLKALSAEYYATDPSQALAVAESAYQLSLHLPDPASAYGEWALANALVFTDRYTEAVRHFAASRTTLLCSALNKNQIIANQFLLEAARMSVGYVAALAYTEQYDIALDLVSEIEPILAESGKEVPTDLIRLGNLYMNLGVIHELNGAYERALDVYQQQEEIAILLSDDFMLAQLKHNRACALTKMNAFAEADTLYKEAESIFSRVNSPPELFRSYLNHASLLVTHYRYQEAEQLYAKAEEHLIHLEHVEQQKHWLTILKSIIRYRSGSKISQTDIQHLQNAYKAFAINGPKYAEGMALTTLGYCYLHQANYESARSSFEDAHALSQMTFDGGMTYQALYGLGNLAEQVTNPKQAAEYYERALVEIEAIRGTLNIETFRADFLSDKLPVYHDLIRLYLAEGNFEKAFYSVERAKSRLLTEKLLFRLEVELKSFQQDQNFDTEVTEHTKRLTTMLRKIDQISRKAHNTLAQQPIELPADAEIEDRKEMARLEHEVRQTIRTIQRHLPTFSSIATGLAAHLPQLQTLFENEVLCQYVVSHNTVDVLVIDQSGILGHKTLAKVEAIYQSQASFAAAIERLLSIAMNASPARLERHLDILLEDTQNHLQQLYAQLIQPIESWLSEHQLIISPDGPLHHIPFHALYDGNRYLIEKQPVAYTPSATMMGLCLRERSAKKNLLLMGHEDANLTSIDKEIKMLSQLFPQRHLATGDQATTSFFLENISDHQLIHIAAHAQFRIDDPLLSSISMADRRLTLAEIARLHLDADLVTLSGCETGYGQLRGADLLSLAGGFLGAGARSLLVSLWRVDDNATAQMMNQFYTNLLADHTRGQAIQQAQLTMLAMGRNGVGATRLYQHPAYWAPFMLTGNWRALD